MSLREAMEAFVNFDIKVLEKKLEVGSQTDVHFTLEGYEPAATQTGVEAGHPYLAQVNTYLYRVGGHLYESKIDVDSNRVLATRHIDFFDD